MTEEVKRLQAENEKLRAALKEIAECTSVEVFEASDGLPALRVSDQHRYLASEALEGRSEP